VNSLAEIAKELAATGWPQRAEQITHAAADPPLNVVALTGVAWGLAEAGHVDRAEHLAIEAEQRARTITDPRGDDDVVVTIVQALIKSGNIDRAEQMILGIETPRDRSTVMTRAAAALVEAGHAERAARLAQTLDDPDLQTAVVTAVTRALVQTGDAEGADRLARTIPDPHRQAQVLKTVGTTTRADHKSGPFSPSILNIVGPQHQILPEIALELSAGNLDRAEELAHDITEPSQQTAALKAVAEAASQSKARRERHRARRIAASLLTTPSWPHAIPILASLDPAAVDAAAVAFLETFRGDVEPVDST
jgi:hypothetical protein